MIVIDQKISETIPKMLCVDTVTGCGSLGLNTVWTVYSGLVPMSPKTTPRAPTASAHWAAARWFELTVPPRPARLHTLLHMTLPRPLDGLRVLDLSRAVAGPFAGRILADLGADVVKAELPGTDVAQSYGKVTRGRSGLYSHVNAGKRSILLDLHQPAGVERLLDLATACDVLVENFRPGVLDRFGVGWPVLAAANPRLVMLSISGFGQDGEDAGRAAYAPVIHAEAGLIGRQADLTGDPPEDIAFALADTLAGLHGTIAILAALRLRDRTGTGQHIDLSMLEAMLATDDYTHYSIDEHPVWPARGEVWPAPGGPILVSADRRYLWRVLKDCFGLADPDPGVSTEQKVRARAQAISDWMAGHPDRDALKRDLDQARLAWADIRHGGDVLAAPPVAGRGPIAEVTDGAGGRRSVARMPYRFSGASSGPPRGVPEPGGGGLAAPSVAGRGTIVEVTDGDGERRSVVRMPYRFSGASSGPPRGVPEPGEHTDAVLRDWTSGPELPYRWSAPKLTRGGSHGTSGADRPQAHPGNRRGQGRGIQVARVAGAPQLAQGQRDQPRGRHAGCGRARLPAQRRRQAAGRAAVAHHRRAAQRPAPALVRRHAGRPDPGAARRRQAHPAG